MNKKQLNESIKFAIHGSLSLPFVSWIVLSLLKPYVKYQGNVKGFLVFMFIYGLIGGFLFPIIFKEYANGKRRFLN